MMARKKTRRARGGASILCPKCETPTRVLKTRRDGPTVARRRECLSCGRQLTTTEARA